MSMPYPRSLPHPKPSASVSEQLQCERLSLCGISEDISFRYVHAYGSDSIFATLLQINDG